MNFEFLKSKLEKKYIIEHYIDLNKFDNQHHSVLYSVLKNVKQQEYKDEYRIVFYYFCSLNKTYDDSPPDLIDYLQKVLTYYDIPNFFCIIVTNDDNISEHLACVSERRTVNEPDPIKYIICQP